MFLLKYEAQVNELTQENEELLAKLTNEGMSRKSLLDENKRLRNDLIILVKENLSLKL